MSCLQALVLADAKGIKDNCMKLGAGGDLYALFAGILTMRPWNRVSDHSELQVRLYFPILQSFGMSLIGFLPLECFAVVD